MRLRQRSANSCSLAGVIDLGRVGVEVFFHGEVEFRLHQLIDQLQPLADPLAGIGRKPCRRS